jgi:hypothetical protein
MKKILFSIVCYLMVGNMVWAQRTPLHIVDTSNSLGPSHSPVPFVLKYTNRGTRRQAVYTANDFPSMPLQGLITDVYLQIFSLTPKGAKLKGLRVRMKPTEISGFPNPGMGNTPIFHLDTGLTTVYYDSMYVAPDTIFPYGWMRLQLPVPYTYSFDPGGVDRVQNLMVDIGVDSILVQPMFPPYYYRAFTLCAYDYVTSRILFVNASYDPVSGADSVWRVTENNRLIIGFNPKPDPLGVNEVQQEEERMLYPNPVNNQLYLSRYAGGYKVYNLTGIKQAEGVIKQGEGIEVQNLPAGMYLLQTEEGKMYKFVKE